MYIQHTKNWHKVQPEVGNYKWLSEKRPTITWMSSKDEYIIRHELKKLEDDQKVKVINQLLKWIEMDPNISSLKVPEKCIKLLNVAANNEAVKTANISRIASFRNSFRRTILPNKVSPMKVDLNRIANHPRTVTFNDKPTIYSIHC
ncbi:PREDICTED: uncharacterized protein LOC108566225 isoform X2 [Nicrophorus vespilloides]|nr:PREDICTED: uncharacterized protein LOC108566225 isoform X2 [Nicrophorus vespilloides]